MWQKPLFIIILFYLFILLQNSFFVHYSLFGATPNLVFILFFLLAFFVKKDRNYQIIYLSAIAGILLDISSYAYLGVSIVVLMAIGFMLKKTQSSLKNMADSYPFAHFLPLFIVFFIVYRVLAMAYLQFIDPSHILMSFNLSFIAGIAYNTVFAVIGFWIFKKLGKKALR